MARAASTIRCQELPGQKLFQFRNEEGKPEDIDSDDVNAYIREVIGEEYSAKDFRTWAGTLLAAQALANDGAGTAAARKRRVVSTIAEVAERLGNTPAVCRKCYIHPFVLDAFMNETLALPPARGRSHNGLSAQERALIALLRSATRKNGIAQRSR